jgi:hypothetical protein
MSNEAKPILLVGVPIEDATQDRLDAIVLGLERKFNGEYYVLSFTTASVNEPVFKVLNPSKMEKQAFSKLKEDVLKIVKGNIEAAKKPEPSRIITLNH